MRFFMGSLAKTDFFELFSPEDRAQNTWMDTVGHLDVGPNVVDGHLALAHGNLHGNASALA